MIAVVTLILVTTLAWASTLDDDKPQPVPPVRRVGQRRAGRPGRTGDGQRSAPWRARSPAYRGINVLALSPSPPTVPELFYIGLDGGVKAIDVDRGQSGSSAVCDDDPSRCFAGVSPDSTQIAFSAAGELVVQSERARPASRCPGSARLGGSSLPPCGRRMALDWPSPRPRGCTSSPAAGGGLRLVAPSNDARTLALPPSWSPDGGSLVYLAGAPVRGAEPGGSVVEARYTVVTVDLTTGETRGSPTRGAASASGLRHPLSPGVPTAGSSPLLACHRAAGCTPSRQPAVRSSASPPARSTAPSRGGPSSTESSPRRVEGVSSQKPPVRLPGMDDTTSTDRIDIGSSSARPVPRVALAALAAPGSGGGYVVPRGCGRRGTTGRRAAVAAGFALQRALARAGSIHPARRDGHVGAPRPRGRQGPARPCPREDGRVPEPAVLARRNAALLRIGNLAPGRAGPRDRHRAGPRPLPGGSLRGGRFSRRLPHRLRGRRLPRRTRQGRTRPHRRAARSHALRPDVVTAGRSRRTRRRRRAARRRR